MLLPYRGVAPVIWEVEEYIPGIRWILSGNFTCRGQGCVFEDTRWKKRALSVCTGSNREGATKREFKEGQRKSEKTN